METVRIEIMGRLLAADQRSPRRTCQVFQDHTHLIQRSCSRNARNVEKIYNVVTWRDRVSGWAYVQCSLSAGLSYCADLMQSMRFLHVHVEIDPSFLDWRVVG